MSHVYVVTSATHVGDLMTITGTVGGIPVTVTLWFSAITKLASTLAVQNFIAPLMLAQAISDGNIAAPSATTVSSVTVAGTFTQ